MEQLELYIPKLEDLWFYQRMRSDPETMSYNANWDNEAYNAMSETQDVQLVLACARRYFAGEQTAEPVWEIMSDKPARAAKDITDYLHK